jgi:alpha-glucosidase (family GH31 glycosyl hydrolase)
MMHKYLSIAKNIILLLFTSILCFQCKQSAPKTASNDANTLTIKAEKNEYWYTGILSEGDKMPFSTNFEANTTDNVYGNQAQPLVLSTDGRGVWCDGPFALHWHDGTLKIDTAAAPLQHFKQGSTLKEAYLYASNKFFPPQGKLPNPLLFSMPQYNTWIELMYNQNQADILKYAQNILDNGLPPGVLMIDDNWQEDYGKWRFKASRFPNPKAMMQKLHAMGFKVMVWVCPFVSPDSDVYRDLRAKGAFITTKTDKKDPKAEAVPTMISWWNGFSAVLDLSNPVAENWFKNELKILQTEFGVDGFKLDAGDANFYITGQSKGNVSANEQSALFAKIGLDFPLNEYRATWKMGGQPLVQRLRDKNHNWEDLQKLMPQMMVEGLMGYYFSCPDMIGGGEFSSFLGDAVIDQALIVRSAQCHALMPMMQFSVGPWRILDKNNLASIKKVVAIRQKFAPYILKTAQESAISGEPILRPLEFEYPHQGYAMVKDAFLIGKNLLVAPVVEKGQTRRKVMIPEGKWKSFKGEMIVGPAVLEIEVGLDDLIYFEKL